MEIEPRRRGPPEQLGPARGGAARGCDPAAPVGLFVGVTSVDVVHLVDRLPAPNEKRAALDVLVTAGGPVTTAAVTFAWLGGRAHVVSALGRHRLAAIARDDLAAHGVRHTDLAPEGRAPPHTCSVLVTEGTGDRAVVYRALPPSPPGRVRPDQLLRGIDVLLVDGHQLPASVALAAAARAAGIPVVLDGGSWRDRMEELLDCVDYAVCSETFRPPGCRGPREALEYLAGRSVPYRAVTRGPAPILCSFDGEDGEVPVPAAERVVDTLGAGDVFHGAFCYHLVASGRDCRAALREAAAVATASCSSLGPRAWMDARPGGG